MKKTRKLNRWLALTLCLCLLAIVCPFSDTTYAAGTDCSHVHDESCGYIEAVEGQPCTFTHAMTKTAAGPESRKTYPARWRRLTSIAKPAAS